MTDERRALAGEAEVARAELVACLYRVSTGDRLALEDLYKRTSAKLFGICKRILSDPMAAEDVLQEVFVTVWNKAGQFEAERGVSPITWLAAMTRNRALDRLRTQARKFVPVEDAVEVFDPRPLADSVLEGREEDRRLRLCLEGLEARAAGAIRAAFFGGQTYQALAAQAGVPLATMKSVIRRGLQQLRLCMDHG